MVVAERESGSGPVGSDNSAHNDNTHVVDQRSDAKDILH